MLRASHHAFGYARPLDKRVGVEVAKFEACLQQPSYAHVNLFFTYFAILDGLRQVLVFTSAFHVCAAYYGLGCCCRRTLGHLMASLTPKIAYRSAVAYHKTAEAPLVAQYLLQQTVAAAAGVAVQPLIGAHLLFCPRLLHKMLEGRQVSLPQVARREVVDVEVVARLFRSAVHGKVLGTGVELHVFMPRRTLQAFHHCLAQARVHVGVFAVSLLSASPARVAEDVDVGRPERKTLVFAHRAGLALRRVLGSRLVAYRRIDALEQHIIER